MIGICSSVAAAERRHSGAFDPLTPELIAYLAGSLKAESLALNDEVRWTARGSERKRVARERLLEDIAADLKEAIELRALGDIAAITAQWGGGRVSRGFSLSA